MATVSWIKKILGRARFVFIAPRDARYSLRRASDAVIAVTSFYILFYEDRCCALTAEGAAFTRVPVFHDHSFASVDLDLG